MGYCLEKPFVLGHLKLACPQNGQGGGKARKPPSKGCYRNVSKATNYISHFPTELNIYTYRSNILLLEATNILQTETPWLQSRAHLGLIYTRQNQEIKFFLGGTTSCIKVLFSAYSPSGLAFSVENLHVREQEST